MDSNPIFKQRSNKEFSIQFQVFHLKLKFYAPHTFG